MRRPTLPRPRLRRRPSKPTDASRAAPPDTASAASGNGPTAPTAPSSTPATPASTPPAGTAVPSPTTQAPGADAPPPDSPAEAHRRIDGLRAWLAQLDRKLGVRTYALGAGVVLALAAGIVGVVLALSVQNDAATSEDLATLRDEVAAAKVSAAQAAQRDVQSLSDRLDQLESEITRVTNDQRTTEREIQVIQGDIRDLQDQVSNLETSGAGAGTGTGAGAGTGTGTGTGSGTGGAGAGGTP